MVTKGVSGSIHGKGPATGGIAGRGGIQTSAGAKEAALAQFASAFGGGVVTPGAIATLLGDIPIANDGDVITADYHNTLREALLALAVLAGESFVQQEVTRTWTPALIPNPQASWELFPQYAGAKSTTEGWMPIEPPHGATLKSLSTITMRSEHVKLMDVTLNRLSMSEPDGNPLQLAEVEVTGGDDQTNVDTASVSASGGGNDAAIVDLESYRYWISVSVQSKDQPDTEFFRLYGIQLTYSFT